MRTLLSSLSPSHAGHSPAMPRSALVPLSDPVPTSDPASAPHYPYGAYLSFMIGIT